MSSLPCPGSMRSCILLSVFFLFLVCGTCVYAEIQDNAPEPAVYLNFNEGSGTFALDSSGHGNAGAIHNASRIESGVCGQALVFSRPDSYVAIPFRTLNHPAKEITVSAWFFTDTFRPAVLVSGYHDGGYRLGFNDGMDLWWTVNLEGKGDVSVPVLRESITPHQWHQVTGTYDGNTLKIYLDGILRNQVTAAGTIHYEDDNYVTLGAEAGPGSTPDLQCPHFFRGGLDEVRIYPVALTYGQVMDDRFRCSQEAVTPPVNIAAQTLSDSCETNSGSVTLGLNDSVSRVLSFSNKTENGTWQVSLQPGSLLRVRAFDLYAKTYPDAWYLEIADEYGKPARTIAFPNTNNAPAEAMLPSGNATVLVRYFNGGERFPAHVALEMESLPPEPPLQTQAQNILANPIIVIYSASWITLIAILLVMVWVHRRRNAQK
jgi:hypothetical protein